MDARHDTVPKLPAPVAPLEQGLLRKLASPLGMTLLIGEVLLLAAILGLTLHYTTQITDAVYQYNTATVTGQSAAITGAQQREASQYANKALYGIAALLITVWLTSVIVQTGLWLLASYLKEGKSGKTTRPWRGALGMAVLQAVLLSAGVILLLWLAPHIQKWFALELAGLTWTVLGLIGLGISVVYALHVIVVAALFSAGPFIKQLSFRKFSFIWGLTLIGCSVTVACWKISPYLGLAMLACFRTSGRAYAIS